MISRIHLHVLVPMMIVIAFLDDAKAATIHVPREHKTIQAAVNAASPGDTIIVDPGTYRERIQMIIAGERPDRQGHGSSTRSLCAPGSLWPGP